MNEPQPTALLPSIAHLLKRAGALERVGTPDLETIARLPAFQSESWRRAIAEFLRWSGSTLTPGSNSSVFELLLTHGRVGALAVYRPFREFLLERGGGSPDETAAKLEAVRGVVSLAAHWIREIDWNLDDADGITAQDLDARKRPVPAIGPAAPSASSRTFPREAASEEVPSAGSGERGEEHENSPEREGASVEVHRRAADLSIPLFRADPTVRSLWKKPPLLSERAVPPPASPRPKGPTA